MTNDFPIIHIEGLTKHFGARPAVKNLSFDVHRGDLFGFLGPNGAGKSTTLYILLGLVYPTAGRALVFGKSPTDLDTVRSKIGSIIETPSFYPHLSARKNLEVSARLLGTDALRTVPAALERTGLGDAADVKVRAFSGGMKQRLGIARALLGAPKLLILDEPTNGLDPEGTEVTWHILEEFTHKEGKTVLISSHLLYEIEEHCNHVCVIRGGESVACGEVTRLLQFENRPIEVVCEDEESANRLRAIVEREPWLALNDFEARDRLHIRIVSKGRTPADVNSFLVESGIRLEKFTPVHKTLKEFFLSLTTREE